MTAHQEAIGGESGFLKIYAGSGVPQFDTSNSPSDNWAIIQPGISIKKYPCCYYTHSGIAAAITLRRTEKIEPLEIEEVLVTIAPGARLPYDDPTTGLEAKFSNTYTIATALVNGTVTLSSFERAVLTETRTLQERVKIEVDDDLPYSSFETVVRIQLSDGTTRERIQKAPPGGPENPLSDSELHEKFRRCASQPLQRSTAEDF